MRTLSKEDQNLVNEINNKLARARNEQEIRNVTKEYDLIRDLLIPVPQISSPQVIAHRSLEESSNEMIPDDVLPESDSDVEQF